MFSDDDLMNLLVLKGDNALDVIHRIASRASIDLDFSVENDFDKYADSTHKCNTWYFKSKGVSGAMIQAVHNESQLVIGYIT